MPPRIFVSAVFAAFSMMPVWAEGAPTLIDFDDPTLSSGDIVGSTFSGLGVTFTDAEIFAANRLGQSMPNVINHDTLNFQIDPSDPIEATFAFDVSFVGVRGLDAGIAGVLLRAYDSVVGGTLIGSDQAVGSGLGVNQFFDLQVSGANIRRVEMSQVADNSSDGIAFDDFTFTQGQITSIPIPATIGLLAFSLACLAGAFGLKNRSIRKHVV